ncbi:MAG: hypothetical protein M3065_11940 [Actinomycetota bacterium]|nr:hypothetical protein [Actinomycetota bacterium]
MGPNPAAPTGALVSSTRFVLRHRKLVVIAWVVLIAGIVGASRASRLFTNQFSQPVLRRPLAMPLMVSRLMRPS